MSLIVVAVILGTVVLTLLVVRAVIRRARHRARISNVNLTPPLSQSEAERVSAVVKQAGYFMDASMLLVDISLLNNGQKTQKVGTYLYLVGAVDALCQQYKLGNDAFTVAAFHALRNFGVSDYNAHGLCAILAAMSTDSFGRQAMIEGGKSLQRFLSAGDATAPLRLSDLVRHWAANQERGF